MLPYKNKVAVAAHRGNSKYFPENTLAAMKSALSLPVDMLETDVHMTSDGELVIMHDDRVDRTTNGRGLIREMTLSEIRKLDAGAWYSEKFRGERVPTLSELLELTKSRPDILFNIELKDYISPEEEGEFGIRPERVSHCERSADKIIAMLREYGVFERCVINCWGGRMLEYVAEKYPDAKIHAYSPEELMGLGQKRNLYTYAYCVCLWGPPEARIVPDHIFNTALAYGVEPWIYLNRECAEEYDLAIDRGARLITANDPLWVIEYLRKKGLHE